ncbi:MAG TPA: sensor histidine kinase [Armatimonadota bacterium]
MRDRENGPQQYSERLRVLQEENRILREQLAQQQEETRRLLLLSNALKYSTPGSPVLIRAQRMADMVPVSVTDQGPGIPPEDLPHIFERFYRAKDAGLPGRRRPGSQHHQNAGRGARRPHLGGE